MVKLYSALASVLISFSCLAQAPDFTGTNFLGDEISLYDDYLDQGTTVLIEFFYTGCQPCLDQAPFFEEMYQEWGAGQTGVEFIGISHEDTDEQCAAFASQFDISYPIIGASGEGFAISEMYNNGDFGDFYGYPAYVIIAPDGTIAYNPLEDNLETLQSLHQNLLEITAAGTVSVQPHVELSLEYYPNPVMDELTITTSTPCEVKIKSITGATVHSESIESTSQIDCQKLDAGIYFIQATQGGKTFTSKFFKK
jgi:peroxiredoxin